MKEIEEDIGQIKIWMKDRDELWTKTIALLLKKEIITKEELIIVTETLKNIKELQ